MCKILEKMINRRLRWIIEKNRLLSQSLNGFRQFRSTIDNLIMLESEIQDSFMNSQHLTMISLDIEKAYDMTWRTRILQILLRQKITGNMFCFVWNFLNQRTIRVRANGVTSKQVTIDKGVPQGSILSVNLFLLAINDILNNISLPVKGYFIRRRPYYLL